MNSARPQPEQTSMDGSTVDLQHRFGDRVADTRFALGVTRQGDWDAMVERYEASGRTADQAEE